MSIYKKLAQARVKLQEKDLKKSGRNSFSKYDYFELKDFLPEVNRLFNELGLCGVVSFTEQLATLTIYDAESDAKIEFTSPMKEAALKGCHEIQNLGAVETYQRRYLYMTALEIVEGDVLDENTGNENASNEKETPKPKSQNNSKAPPQQNMSSTPPKSFADTMKERFVKYQTPEEFKAVYDTMLTWVTKNHPNNIDEFNMLYDEYQFNLMH